MALICVDNGVNAYVVVQHVLLKDVIHEVNIMKLSNIVTVIILAISSTLTPQ
ncbi:maltose ABC transporter substrate-binding protein, partial [Escherichia coli]|nr:maltose ABC transporter substrate-binding protein [Escherichia coli]